MMMYTETHEWIKVDGKIGTVGVSQYAQGELGDVVYVELPELGMELTAGQEATVLESTKAAADVYTPVSGTIVEVNTALNDNPELVNESPEAKGWLFKLELTAPDDLAQLSEKDVY
jgi:glycine cleavage system H protein